MAFPSYSDIWQKFLSGHFDVAAQAAIAKAELSQEQSYHYVTDAFAYYAKGYRDHQYTYHYSEIKRQFIEPQLERLRGTLRVSEIHAYSLSNWSLFSFSWLE